MSKITEVYIEPGMKRVFAGAVNWPGWCRSARDEEGALRALLEYGPRYERVMRAARIEFRAPKSQSDLKVVERLTGNTTTDFGAPGMPPAADRRGTSAADRRRFEALLKACWSCFDAACRAAKGKRLSTGPRGGGRDLQKIVEHVLGADGAYLTALGWKVKLKAGDAAGRQLKQIREAIVAGLAASVQGEIPDVGPRGGKRWTARYFVRRSAWHVLDHAWEIEDRVV